MADHHLHFAAENGYLQIVKDLVDGEPSLVNERGEHGGTPLMFAAFGGQLEIVQYLISKKACVEFVSQGGFTALYWACHRGFKAVVETLIEAGAKHQALTNGRTPLMDAVAENQTDVVEVLLDRKEKIGLDIDALDEEGRSALCMARALSRAQAEEMLLHAGADINLFEPATERTCMSPTTFYPARQGLGKKVMSFTRALSTDELQKVMSSTSLKELEEVVKKWIELDRSLVHKRGMHGGTPLMFASFGGHQDIVQYLIDNKARVDSAEDGGYTPLYWAAHRGHANIVSLLVRHGANPKVSLDDGRTPLMDAVAEGNTEVIKVLAGSSDLNAVDKMGRSALSFAKSMGRTEAERILLAHGARPAPVAAVNGSTYE